MNRFDFTTAFSVDFDTVTGRSEKAAPTERHLSQMKGMYFDTEETERILAQEDPLIYEYYELGCPEDSAGDLAFGTTILYPGRVGDEYYMTKGHFHVQLETAEVYYTLAGEGCMVMENPEGDTIEVPLKAGEAMYVPKRYAHRTVNTGSQPLVVFWTFAADAGHDYGTIETKGYHKMVVEKDGRPQIIDNPRWKES